MRECGPDFVGAALVSFVVLYYFLRLIGSALALPVALPVLVLTAFWHAARQNAEDDRFREDD